ncbi:tectonin beta-propeller repeat-containing protein 2-like [Glandiceps talaboti]
MSAKKQDLMPEPALIPGKDVIIKEFQPLSYLYQHLPQKAQRGIRNIDIQLTSIDVNAEFIVLGCNIGLIFLFDRKTRQITKFKCDSGSHHVTTVKLSSSLDDLVAAGTSNGHLHIYQLPSRLPGHHRELRKHVLEKLHTCAITCAEWSTNGMKLYTGDTKGRVIYTAVDFYNKVEEPCKPTQILTEGSEIVQLSYAHKILLVSTLQRSVLCYTDEDNRLQQVGQNARKNEGGYGACFVQEVCKPSDAILYASRPGLRLWKASTDGIVLNTYFCKGLIKHEHPTIEVLPDTAPSRIRPQRTADKHFGVVKIFADRYILTWCDNLLYVVDPEQQVIVGSIQGTVGQIASVATFDDEIFILRSGDTERPVIRIAISPEPKPYRETEQVPLDNPTRVAESISNFRVGAAGTADLEELRKKFRPEDESNFSLIKLLPQTLVSELRSSEGSQKDATEVNRNFFPNSPNLLRRLLPQSLQAKKDNGESLQEELENLKPGELEGDELPPPKTPEAELSKEIMQARTSVLSTEDVRNTSDVNREPLVNEPVTTTDTSKPDVPGPMVTVTTADSSKSDIPSQVKTQNNNLKPSQDIVFKPNKKKKLKKSKFRDSSPHKEENPNIKPDSVSLCSTTSSISDPGSEIITDTAVSVEDTRPTDILEPEQVERTFTDGAKVKPNEAIQKPSDDPETVEISTENVAQNLKSETEIIVSNDVGEAENQRDNLLNGDKFTASQDIEVENLHADTTDFDQNIAKDKEYPSDGSGSDFGDVVHEINEHVNSMTFDVLESNDGVSTTDSSSSQSTEEPMNSSLEDIYSAYKYDTYDQQLMPSGAAANLSPVEQSIEKITMKDLQVKISDSWVQCKVPNNVTYLTASDKHLWCIDSHDKVYHCLSTLSGSIKWSKLKDSAKQFAVSPSENIVWCVHRKSGSAYASTKSTLKTPIGSAWTKVVTNCALVALDDTQAWILKTNGDLMLMKGLTRDEPFSRRSLHVGKGCHLSQMVSYKGAVWGLTLDNKIVYRAGISDEKPEGIGWKLLDSRDERLVIKCIALGGQNIAWAIDDKGAVWFRAGVSMVTPKGEDGTWWQVAMSDYLMQEANIMESVLKFTADIQRPVEYVTNWWKGAQPSLIAANHTSVWVSGGKNTLHVSRGNLLGHRWEVATPIGIADSARWLCLSAAAAKSRTGLVWALQPNGEVFCFPPNTRKPTPVIPPLNVMFKYISATSESVWGLSVNAGVYIRAGMAPHCPQGISWKPLDLSQLGNVQLVYISCGAESVWACDSNGNIYFRMDVRPPQHALLNPAWVPVEGKPTGLGTYFIQVVVSPNDKMIWALDSRKTVYVRKGIGRSMPIGSHWDPVPGTPSVQLSISNDMVWALCPNGDIACRYGISDKNAIGDYWKKIPGNYAHITASPTNHLWALDRDGHMYQRITRTLNRATTQNDSPEAAKQHSAMAEDWEFL